MRTAFVVFLMALSCVAQPWTMNDPAWLGQQAAPTAGGGPGTLGKTTTTGSIIGPDANQVYAYRAQATSSGTLTLGEIWHNDGTAGSIAIIAVYTSNNSSLPSDTALSLVGYCTPITAGSSTGWKTASMNGGSVTSGAFYWVVVIRDTTVATWQGVYDGTATLFYRGDANTQGWYPTPPSTLSASGWSTGSGLAPFSAYVTIQ